MSFRPKVDSGTPSDIESVEIMPNQLLQAHQAQLAGKRRTIKVDADVSIISVHTVMLEKNLSVNRRHFSINDRAATTPGSFV